MITAPLHTRRSAGSGTPMPVAESLPHCGVDNWPRADKLCLPVADSDAAMPPIEQGGAARDGQ
jgi:hypothetical protein